jgi:hypothetical protein
MTGEKSNETVGSQRYLFLVGMSVQVNRIVIDSLLVSLSLSLSWPQSAVK